MQYLVLVTDMTVGQGSCQQLVENDSWREERRRGEVGGDKLASTHQMHKRPTGMCRDSRHSF